MKAVALIVEHETPDLLALCLASLKRFAPEVRPLVLRGYEGAAAHAVEIEAARRHQKLGDAEIVVLLDTDVVILSEKWIQWLKEEFADEGMCAVGGLRHRGDVTQLYYRGELLLHAHCLAMRRDMFDAIESFAADNRRWDTGWQVQKTAQLYGVMTYARIPQDVECWPGWPFRVGLYADLDEETLMWAHLGRGTSFRPRGPWRERARRLAARLGSPRAQKILSYQQDRAAFLRKGWEIVQG